MLTDALVGYVLNHTIFGERTTRVDRDRMIAAWTRIVVDHIDPDDGKEER